MQPLYRFFSYLWHQLSAWNTGGEGIHSPYLFYIVSMLMYDRNGYYIWRQIERQRNEMLASAEYVETEDFGTGASLPKKRRVGSIAATSLEQPKIAQLLFRLTLFLSQNSQRNLNVLELGTNLGITTAYLAAADRHNTVYTFEGCGQLLRIARQNHIHLNIKNIIYVSGNIDDTLPKWTQNEMKDKQLDLAFLDANHTCEATMRYFNMLLPLVHKKTVIIVDDIYHSPQMAKAWKQIKTCRKVTSTMDIYNAGIVFFDPDYIRRDYKLRY